MFVKNKQLEALKRYAQNLRRLERSQQLSPWPQANDLVYEIKPTYLEISQGGASPMRGWGALIFMFGLAVIGFGMFLSAEAIWLGRGTNEWLDTVLIDGVLLLVMAFCCLVPLYWLYMSFFAVTDVVVRFDRKRGKVWMWTGGGPIEMRWADLEPAVIGMAASAQLPGRTYRGIYAEFEERGEFKTTRKIPHVIQVGQVSGAEEGVMPALEYVREFMERGPDVLPPPNRLLQHRPRWYAMFNFLGMADEWALIAEGKPAPLGKPWFRTAVFVVFFPLLFPLQFTNWLALRLAPIPKWPSEIADMHAADLAEELARAQARRAADTSADRAQEASRPRRRPVVRVNGELVDPDGADSSM